MSLRDNSTMCVMNIVKHFGELGFDERVYNALIMSGLMPELRTGLRSKKQVGGGGCCGTMGARGVLTIPGHLELDKIFLALSWDRLPGGVKTAYFHCISVV